MTAPYQRGDYYRTIISATGKIHAAHENGRSLCGATGRLWRRRLRPPWQFLDADLSAVTCWHCQHILQRQKIAAVAR